MGVKSAVTSELAELLTKSRGTAVDSDKRSIKKYRVMLEEVLWCYCVEILSTKYKEGILWDCIVEIERDLTKECEILNETTAFTLRGVAGTHHAPLTRLQ